MRKAYSILTALLAIAAFSIELTAGNSRQIPFVDISVAQDSVNELNGVEVTASPLNKLSASAPVQSIDANSISNRGIADMATALRQLPGINLRDYGGNGGLKTVSVRGFGASHTAVNYDGVTLSDVQSGQIDLSRYSLENLSELQMHVGDNQNIWQSARSASSPASIHIQTDAKFNKNITKPEGTIHLKAGSFRYMNAFFRGVLPIKKIIIQTSGEFTNSKNNYPFRLTNGTETHTERRNNSNINGGNAEINVLWHINKNQEFVGKTFYYDQARHLPGPVIYYNNINHERLNDRNAFTQLRYRARFNNRLSLQASAKFNWASSKYTDENGKYPGGILRQFYWQREWYITGAVLFTPLHDLSVDYSADYFYNNLNSNLSTDTHPNRHSIMQMVAAKYSWKRFTVSARGLLSIFKSGDFTSFTSSYSRLSPSASLSWQPFDYPLNIRASYKEIYRMPTFSELYFDHFGSLELKPETTEQFNIGITSQLPDISWFAGGNVTLDLYKNSIRDMIVAVPYNMFVWTMKNLSHARIYGIDASLEINFTPAEKQNLSINGSYSYQRAQPRTNPTAADWMKQVAYTPLNSGTASIGWENRWVNVAANCTAVSARFAANNNLPQTRIPGYADFGASVWKFFNISKISFETRINILNILNKQYSVIANYPMPGRSWQISLKFNF